MNEGIIVFTDSDQFYETVKKIIGGQKKIISQCSVRQYKTVNPKGIKMVLLDLIGDSDTYNSMMQIFYIRCHINKPILVCTDNEERRYLLNLFTFGVEEYITNWYVDDELKKKVDAVLRYQRWMELLIKE